MHGIRFRWFDWRTVGAPLIFLSIALATSGLGCRENPPNTDAATLAIDSLPSPAGSGSAEPNLTVDGEGGSRVYMTWLEPADSGHALKFAALDGERWTEARTIRTGRDFFVNWADFPSIEVLDGGRLAVHWLQRNGSGTYAYGVRVSQSADGGKTWSAAVMPHRDSSQTEHGFVALWRDAQSLGAVWLDGRNFKAGGHGAPDGHNASNEMMLLTTGVSADGALAPEIRLDERTCDCCQNSAAMTAEGPIVAYRDRSPDEIRDVYVTRRTNGRWSTGVPVHRDNWKIAACPVNGPAVAAAGRRVALAWFTAANENPRVKVAFSNDAGASFSPPLRVDGGNPAGRVDVAMLDDASALVTWIERIGGDTAAVRTRRVGIDGKLGRATTIASSSAERASGFPQMAITGSDVVFAWTVPGRPSVVRVARAKVAAFQ